MLNRGMKGINMKITLNNNGKGSGGDFDYDFKLIVIDKTKRPYEKKIVSREDIIRKYGTTGGDDPIRSIDRFIEYNFCWNSPQYIEFRNDSNFQWSVEHQQWWNKKKEEWEKNE